MLLLFDESVDDSTLGLESNNTASTGHSLVSMPGFQTRLDAGSHNRVLLLSISRCIESEDEGEGEGG